jgi:hypothetical protein
VRRLVPLSVLILSACPPQEQTTWYSEGATLELAWQGVSVLDPKLDDDPELRFEVHLAEAPEGRACEIAVEARHRDGRSHTWEPGLSLEAGQREVLSWAGLDAEGLAFDPGLVQLIVSASCEGGAGAAAALEGRVVRVGVTAVDFVEHPEDGGFVPLAYHKLDLLTHGVTELDGLVPEYRGYPGDEAIADLDDEAGQPLDPPAPWTDPDVPPWGAGAPDSSAHSLPAAYAAGSRARLIATTGSTAVSQQSGAVLPALGMLLTEQDDPPTLRLVGEDLDALDPDTPYAPGGTLGFDTEPLPSTLGRHDLRLEWRFQVLGPDGWESLPGSQTTSHEIWITAGEPALRDGAALGFAPDAAWIGVLADLEAAMTGLDPSVAPVLDGVREHLHHDDWLIYNPSDAAYTSYSGSYIYWDYIWVDLSDWLDRDDGIELYCHSMSCLLSTIAGHWGVNAPQQVLGVGFRTNLARAAGTDSWGRWSFNSHSVVSPDDGATIWDASIDLDGDDDPYNEPVEPVSPVGMPGEEYLWRLSYDDIGIVNSGLCYFE